MTEEEWFAEVDWRVLHERVQRRKNYAREVQLFSVACCRPIAHLFDEPKCDEAVVVAELFADGLETRERLDEVSGIVHATIGSDPPHYRGWARDAAWKTALVGGCSAYVCLTAVGHVPTGADVAAELQAQTVLFRDIFQPTARKVKCNRVWLTSDVLALARGIYEDRAFDRMPILADALQDAGCDSPDILSHCRDASQPHVRGCGVVDLLLGKE
jgi:hypothetical protein